MRILNHECKTSRCQRYRVQNCSYRPGNWHVNNLKNLYNVAYEDPESFEDVSAEISNTINEIASTVEPNADDSDLDGLIQEIIKAVDNKAEEIEKELEAKPNKPTRKKLKSR